MATLVEYLDNSNIVRSISTTIGYLSINPAQALQNLFPQFYITQYFDLKIPSKSQWDNLNSGLKLSEIKDGLGLTGTIKKLAQSALFQSCRHKPYSKSQQEQIVEHLKLSLKQIQRREPLYAAQAEKYLPIFEVLEHPLRIEEIIAFSRHPDYGKDIRI